MCCSHMTYIQKKRGKCMVFTKNKVKKVISDIVDEMIEFDFYQWPPNCTGVFYQPDKPQPSVKEQYNND